MVLVVGDVIFSCYYFEAYIKAPLILKQNTRQLVERKRKTSCLRVFSASVVSFCG